jgi:hypothetical protein
VGIERGLVTQFCEHLDRVREHAVGAGRRGEVEAVLEHLRRGRDVGARVEALLHAAGVGTGGERRGIEPLPDAIKRAPLVNALRCPRGVCDRIDVPVPGDPMPVCGIHGEQLTPPQR